MVSVLEWPALGWEEHAWRPSIAPELVSRRIRERNTGPYRAAAVPAIAGLEIRLPSSVAALVDEASVEVARFDAELGAGLAPFAARAARRNNPRA